MNFRFPVIFSLVIVFAGPPAAMAVDFETQIKPILRNKCGKCHTGPKAKGKLRYDHNMYLKKRIGGDDPAIIPGKPMESLLVKKASLPRSDTDAMPPPRRGDPLTISELSLIKRWIEAGASLEKGDTTDVPSTTTAADTDKLHNWVSTAGTTLQAVFVKLDAKTVVLRKEDGSEISVSMSQLAPKSRKQASELAAAK